MCCFVCLESVFSRSKLQFFIFCTRLNGPIYERASVWIKLMMRMTTITWAMPLPSNFKFWYFIEQIFGTKSHKCLNYLCIKNRLHFIYSSSPHHRWWLCFQINLTGSFVPMANSKVMTTYRRPMLMWPKHLRVARLLRTKNCLKHFDQKMKILLPTVANFSFSGQILKTGNRFEISKSSTHKSYRCSKRGH